MLSVPEYAKVVELPTSRFWIEESGIVCVVSRKAAPQTIEQAQSALEIFRKHMPAEKVCLLIDVTNTTESKREVRELAAKAFPEMFTAIAMVSASALGRMLANLFFNLKSQPYPVKMFDSEVQARAWLKNYR
jgi:hypothetical protein